MAAIDHPNKKPHRYQESTVMNATEASAFGPHRDSLMSKLWKPKILRKLHRVCYFEKDTWWCWLIT